MNLWFVAHLTPFAPGCAELPVGAPARNISTQCAEGGIETPLAALLDLLGREPWHVVLRLQRLGEVAVILNVAGEAKVPLAFIVEPGEADCNAALAALIKSRAVERQPRKRES